jgi:hypothetical protein
LKAGVWFPRVLLLIVAPDSQAQRARCQAETPLIALCRIPGPALWKEDRVRLVVEQRCGKRFLAWYGDLRKGWK